MTDTATAEAPAETTAPEADKPAKKVVAEKPCLCRSYELYSPTDPDEVFQTDCELTTKATFAQGHDARLVSFLVTGLFDGYKLRQNVDGKVLEFADPASAVAGVSEALKNKALKATENGRKKLADKQVAKQLREAKKQERLAAAAAKKADAAAAKEAKKVAPKATGAEVVAGSSEGDTTELQPGQALIKVGRWEYVAQVDGEGNATYTDGSGAEQTRERDGYQLLKASEAPAA